MPPPPPLPLLLLPPPLPLLLLLPPPPPLDFEAARNRAAADDARGFGRSPSLCLRGSGGQPLLVQPTTGPTPAGRTAPIHE